MKSIAIAAGVIALIVFATAAYALTRDDGSSSPDRTSAHRKRDKDNDEKKGLANAQERSGKSKEKQMAHAKADNAKPGQGAEQNIAAIAHQFDVSAGDITALRDQGFGFGAIVKLLALAKAENTNAMGLAAQLPKVNGQPDANFEKLFSGLSDQEKARIENLPKNLGQIKQAQAGRAKNR
jgi:hypothetical protein